MRKNAGLGFGGRRCAAALSAAVVALGLVGCQNPKDGGKAVNTTGGDSNINYQAEYQGNPYLPLWEYIPDGEPYVFEDPDNPGRLRLYVYGSHDTLKTEYCGKDLVVWSAPVEDLTDWRLDGVIFESVVNGSADTLYAPDVCLVEKDGKKTYYLYPNNQSWGRNSMVASSARPDGPFTPANFVEGSTTQTFGPLGFDPAVFVDDDGAVYGYWGFVSSWWARLDPENMSDLAPGENAKKNIPSYDEMMSDSYNPEDFNIVQDENVKKWGFFEASSIRKVGNKYVFIYSRNGLLDEPTGKNYNQLAYGYSDSPAGPWKYGGIIVDAAGEVIPDGSGGYQRTFNFGNTHGSICEVDGQWYVFYHRNIQTYARQAMVESITVDWDERPVSEGGEVRISTAEVTSNGFFTNGLNPYQRHSFAIASYMTNSYITPVYEQDATTLPLTLQTGAVVGIKYFNMDLDAPYDGDSVLEIELVPKGVKTDLDIYLRPASAVNTPVERDEELNIVSVGEGSFKLGSISLDESMPSEPTTFTVSASRISELSGQWAVFVVPTTKRNADLCELRYMQLVEK